MCDSILPDSGIDFLSIIIIIFTSIVLGLILALTYIFTHRKESYSPSFTTTLILLPTVVSIIIVLVSNNIARAFSLAGIFALTRFRSEQQDTKDIAYVFTTIAIGLSTGLGYIAYGVLITLILCLLLIILDVSKFSMLGNKSKTLKIIIPEDLNFDNLFDDIFEKYCRSYQLNKSRTTDFGTLFELTYTIVFKKNISEKAFIDEIRTRNSNLNVILTLRKYD